jgi:hypothetical protein
MTRSGYGLRRTLPTGRRPPSSNGRAFEQRLRELDYTPRSIVHAYRILSGPGTVAEALAVLERAGI